MQSLPRIMGDCVFLFCLKAKDKSLEFLFMHLISPKKGYVFALLIINLFKGQKSMQCTYVSSLPPHTSSTFHIIFGLWPQPVWTSAFYEKSGSRVCHGMAGHSSSKSPADGTGWVAILSFTKHMAREYLKPLKQMQGNTHWDKTLGG